MDGTDQTREMDMSETRHTHRRHGREIDPATANAERPIQGTDHAYFEIDKETGWVSNAVYWQGFPPGSSMVLEAAKSIPAGRPPPRDATVFAQGAWQDTGKTSIEARVGYDDVESIYVVTGSSWGGNGYLVVEKVGDTYTLRWYTSASSEPGSLIASAGDTVMFMLTESLSATADKGETWWKATDNEL